MLAPSGARGAPHTSGAQVRLNGRAWRGTKPSFLVGFEAKPTQQKCFFFLFFLGGGYPQKQLGVVGPPLLLGTGKPKRKPKHI